MADSGFDPCECVWSHEAAMRRLLSLLRQSQGDCTDNECFTESPGPLQSEGPIGSDPVFFAMVWAILAMALFFLRPSSLRSSGDDKPSRNNQGGGSPPAPPTST